MDDDSTADYWINQAIDDLRNVSRDESEAIPEALVGIALTLGRIADALEARP